MSAQTEHHPSTMLPFPITGHTPQEVSFWVFLQPIKDEHYRYPHVPYTPEELLFWEDTITSIDHELEGIADGRHHNGHGVPPIVRVAMERFTYGNTEQLNTIISDILTRDDDTGYIGFAQRINPLTAQLYFGLQPQHHETRTRMQLVIIGGASEASIKTTRIFSEIPDHIASKGIIIAHDDVADTLAAFAALVEKIGEMKKLSSYDDDFVQELTKTFRKGYANFRLLYEHLIQKAEAAGVVPAFVTSKNAEFEATLYAYAIRRLQEDAQNRWARYALLLARPTMQLQEQEWVMGLGLDTGFDGKDIVKLLPFNVLQNQRLHPILTNLTLSRMRIGSTVPGLIALAKTDGNDEAIRFKQWLTGRIGNALQAYADSLEPPPAPLQGVTPPQS